ncbi:CBS domain-containing protein CBSCBSPB3-like isoform X1 [Gossypium australe]|uniref:CBS domain-containing protein CBSCBSPB3-like isoform X1 n=1 Tax=Gossypium australe TaxID=47621 RepID=A0A5B6UR46_9ROSI|nr:CBS domain-containing protein CBSCBSPB3-like isoform X1 [Gossypium australe]
MSSQTVPPASTTRRDSQKRRSNSTKKSHSFNHAKPMSPSSIPGERTVKKLRLSKALTIPEGTTVSEACRRMAARRVNAVLLTDSNALLSGIVTDKPEQTVVSKIMTPSPIFVSADSLAIEALQKMVQGKFRHLPVVENGEVIAMLDITKCLYDAISRMEKAVEQGNAIASSVDQNGSKGSGWGFWVEQQYTSSIFSVETSLDLSEILSSHAFMETLRERMFKPSLSSIIAENSDVAVVSSSDPVCVAAKKMRDLRVNSVVTVTGNKIQGILTSKDILMRVVAQNLSPELTLVEKVMTPNPECVTVETTILDALHLMHDGKFLHLPVLDRDGNVAACLDVLDITHAAISMVESSSGVALNEVSSTMMQKFWDSALALDPPGDYDTHSEMSAVMASDGADTGKLSPHHSLGHGNSFSFKFEDLKGRLHRFSFGTENLNELLSAVMRRTASSNDNRRPQLLYKDDEGDKVLLTNDTDLVAAVNSARSIGKKVLRLHLDFSESAEQLQSEPIASAKRSSAGVPLHLGLLAGTVVLTSIGVLVYLKRSKL